jgi:ketosteroid isomerase-like protein
VSNTDVAKRFFDAFNQGGYIENPESIWRDDAGERFAAIFDPECELRPAGADAGQAYRGIEGVRAYLSDLADAWGAIRLEPRNFTEVGDQVVVEHRNYARGRESGATIEQTFWMLFTIRADRILKTQNFTERDAAIAAASG